MKKIIKGLLLIMMMFGHNYTINQAQSLQQSIQQIHQINVPQFNLLYSIPSAISIIFIIPLGILYDKYSLKILIIGTASMVIGQLLVVIFGSMHTDYSFHLLVGGRVGEGVGAQILYMIQGNLASSWMGKLAGLIFILPEVGEIANVFGTPYIASHYGVRVSLVVGLLTCVMSAIACIFLYYYLKTKSNKSYKIEIVEVQSDLPKQNQSTKLTYKKDLQNQHAQQKTISSQPTISILRAGKIFWTMIALCAINEALYFPFLDNANELLKERFCVDYEQTGVYLCLPFISAIIITAIYGQYILHRFERKTLIFVSSLLPFVGHGLIFVVTNCSTDRKSSFWNQIILMLGFIVFGMGLGSYYSVSFPAIAYLVPLEIRGSAYACLCFFQTISMTVVPIISGEIIQSQHYKFDGYQNSSFFFICLSIIGTILSFVIYQYSSGVTFQYQHDEEQVELDSKNETDKKSYIKQDDKDLIHQQH